MKPSLKLLSPLLMGIAVSTIPGCAMLQGPGSTSGERITGLLEHREGEWWMARCGDPDRVELRPTERLERLFERVAQPGQTAIFVDMEADVRRDGTVEPLQILRMESAGEGCAGQQPATQWAANGLHHSWSLAIASQGIQFTGEESEEVGPVSIISEQLPDGSMSFRSERDATLELWLYPQDCFDHSGDFKHYTATLVVKGNRLSGCAYKSSLTL